MSDLPQWAAGIAPNTAICTLFEGDYHFGLAVFVNSLVQSGYRGTVWAGYRGPLPPWLNQLSQVDAQRNEYVVADCVRMVFVPLKVDWHFTNFKPQFMLDLLAGPARKSQYLWYFDPDIFLRCNWSFFTKWQRYGIALCEEIVNYNLRENSPIRMQWMDVGAAMGLAGPRLLSQYFSGGMVGVGAAHAAFLELWKRILEQAAAMGYDLYDIQAWNARYAFQCNRSGRVEHGSDVYQLSLDHHGSGSHGLYPFRIYNVPCCGREALERIAAAPGRKRRSTI